MRNILELSQGVKRVGQYPGDDLKKARQKKKINQVELAKRIGVNQSTVSRWENNKQLPPAENYIALEKELELTPDFFDEIHTIDLATDDIDQVIKEYSELKKRLESLEGKIDSGDNVRQLSTTPTTLFASLLDDADQVTLYACLYLITGSRAHLEKVHSVIKNEVVALRKHIRPLVSSDE